eukprot:7380752-Prymnesium_polylepis.1
MVHGSNVQSPHSRARSKPFLGAESGRDTAKDSRTASSCGELDADDTFRVTLTGAIFLPPQNRKRTRGSGASWTACSHHGKLGVPEKRVGDHACVPEGVSRGKA